MTVANIVKYFLYCPSYCHYFDVSQNIKMRYTSKDALKLHLLINPFIKPTSHQCHFLINILLFMKYQYFN